MLKGFKNARVYVEKKGICLSNIGISSGIIDLNPQIVEGFLELPKNLIIVPGFIDKHMHGANKADSMYNSLESIETICQAKFLDGVTTICPTTMTETKENINLALKNIAKYASLHPSYIGGIHLEGPFICKKYHGAQDGNKIIPCDVEVFKQFNESANGLIKQVTIAPEENGDELISYLKRIGVRSLIGHSNATYETVKKAISLGVTGVTHTFNAQSPFHHREIGVVGSALLFDELYCEVIADLVHVSVPALSVLYKNKKKGKTILVTDSIEATGLADGEYQLGGQAVTVKGNLATLHDGTLAGSVAHMNDVIRNMKNVLDLSLEDAIDLATINPATFLGLEESLGSIKQGKKADLAIIDENLNIYMTIKDGEIVYSKI